MPQLKKHHFIQEDRPINNNYKHIQCKLCDSSNCWTQCCNAIRDEFEKDLKEWKAKYVEPELDFISFKQEKPDVGREIFVKSLKNTDPYIYDGFDHNGTMWLLRYLGEPSRIPVFMDYQGSQDWEYKSDYDKRLAYYNDHKALFEDWEQTDFKNRFIHQKNGRSISIDSDLKTIHLVDKTDATIYQGPCSVELFTAICNENDIKP